MASKIQIENSMKKSFASANLSKNDLAMRVALLNQERDDFIDERTLEVVSEAYLLRHYEIEYNSYTPPGGADKRKSFVKDKLSLEQKLAIITEYNSNSQLLDGDNSIEIRLKLIMDRRKDNKEQFKKEAVEILNAYQKALEENKARIQIAEKDIESIKEQIKKNEEELQKVISKDDESVAFAGRVSGKFNKADAITNLNAEIARLNGELTKKEEELEDLRQIQAKWEANFRKKKVEIDKFLKAKNIYAFRTSENTPEAKKEETKEEVATSKAGNIGGLKSAPKDVAQSMFEDFMTTSPERQRNLLRQSGNDDILKMARRLGPLNRMRLRVIMEQRLDELKSDTVSFTDNSGRPVTINKSEFRNIREMSEEQLKAIREEMDRFNSQFSQKNIEQIEEFEDKLDYIRIATLLQETSIPSLSSLLSPKNVKGYLMGILGLDKKANMIYELAKSSAKYAQLKGERATRKEAMHDRLRVVVGRSKMDDYTKSAEKALDRTGADEFNR